MGNLTKLTNLYISLNELRGCLPELFCELSKLEWLEVNYTQLSGIPKCLGKLSNLKLLALLSNLWEGFLFEHHFFNLTRLDGLIISSKSNLVLNVSLEWVPPFQLKVLYMQSVKVGPKFPKWILTHTQIYVIFTSNTSISESIPVDWFVGLLSYAYTVVLSNNNIKVGTTINNFNSSECFAYIRSLK